MQKMVNGKLVEMTPQEIGQRNAEVARWEADQLANQYKELRKAEFLPVEEQLDMQYHDAKNGTTTWIDHVDAVKNGNPKPI